MKRRNILSVLVVLVLMVIFGYFTLNNRIYDSSDERYVFDNKMQEQDDVYQAKQDSVSKPMKKVGVLMPTRSSERWMNDGINMKAKLEAVGYEVELQFADDVIELQIEQIKTMIQNKVDCLVIASIDSEALVDVLEQAVQAGIYVIAYDRLLMDTDAVSYYATFDNKAIGTQIGKYIEEKKQLKSASKEGRTYTIEFFMGSPDDNNAVFLYNGLMEVLQPYLQDGTLICKSGNTSFEDTCILRWSEETAKQTCLKYLNDYYEEEPLDIACSAFDGFSYGIKTALLSQNYSKNLVWPLITGQDAELNAIKNITSGYQTMSIYKDTRVLANKCTVMVQAVLEGTTPEINDISQYYNGKKTVPSYLCEPIVIDATNYEETLIDGGYYTKVQIMK